MLTHHPSIVKNGLVAYFDAANPKSYPAGQDPYVNSVSLMLDFEGSFSDKSVNNLTVTANGNAQISTTQVKFGNSSGYFDGVGDYLTIANSSLFAMGSGAFTIEFWYYPLASLTNGGLVDLRSSAASSTGLLIRQGDGASSGTTITCWAGTAGGTTPATQTGLNLNAWNHIAVVRDSSNNLTVYINGVGGTSVTRAINLTDQNFRFAAFIDATGSPNAANGYFDDFRITKGVARFTANFTPPTAPLSLPGKVTDLTKNRSSGTLANGPTYSSSNGGSLVFTRSSNHYVNAGALTGSFTSFSIIVWFYPTNIANYENILDLNYGYSGSNGNIGPRLEMNAGGNLAWIYSNSGSNLSYYAQNVISSGMTANTWYCVGITYDGSGNSSITYLNGLNTANSRSTIGSPTGFIGSMNSSYFGVGYSLSSYTERGFDGRIAMVQIYNRTLTATEMLQNYTATKGRFRL